MSWTNCASPDSTSSLIAGEPFVGQIHLHETAVHLVAAVVEPIDRRAVLGREGVGLCGSRFNAVASGLRQRLEQCVSLGLDRDPVLLAELRNPLP